MVDKKQDQDNKKIESDEWFSDFNDASLQNALKYDILPSIKVDEVGLENAIKVVVLSEPHKIELPKEKANFSKYAYPFEVKYESEKVQIYCTNALRFNLALIKKKYGKLIGLNLRIWKELSDTEYGTKPMYRASVID
ncbi:MAG: hypothetical protein P8Y70_01485 [Candidatus Lokiarchaeota archaeon]